MKSESEVAQSCPTLHDLMDCSLPGSSVHGIFQARVLEWVAIAFSITEDESVSFILLLSFIYLSDTLIADALYIFLLHYGKSALTFSPNLII